MKGLILSGGKGTRLYPITYTRAKQLVPVANKPVLFRVIEAIRDAGITEIGIVVGDTAKEIRETVGPGKRWGVKITYIPQKEPLGLAHAVKISRDYLGDDRFVMFLGDNVIQGGISGLISEFETSQYNCQIVLTAVDNPSSYGVAELDPETRRIIRLVEKPRNPPSNLALVGIYMFDEHVWEAVAAIKPSWRGELEITDAIQYLVDKGYVVHPYVHEGWWIDTGEPGEMLEANDMVLDEVTPSIEGYVDRESQIQRQGYHRKRSRDHQQPHPRTGHHRRGYAHRQFVCRTFHVDLSPRRDRKQRDRAQHGPGKQQDPGYSLPDRGQPDRAGFGDYPLADQAQGAQGDAGRSQQGRNLVGKGVTVWVA